MNHRDGRNFRSFANRRHRSIRKSRCQAERLHSSGHPRSVPDPAVPTTEFADILNAGHV